MRRMRRTRHSRGARQRSEFLGTCHGPGHLEPFVVAAGKPPPIERISPGPSAPPLPPPIEISPGPNFERSVDNVGAPPSPPPIEKISPGPSAPPLPPPIEISPGPNFGRSIESGLEKQGTKSTNTVQSAPTVAHGEDRPAFVGGWAAEQNDCGSRVTESPLKITPKKAETANAACEFVSIQRSGTAWRVRANCAAGQERWVANITLTVGGNRLTWSSERGKATYVRCSEN